MANTTSATDHPARDVSAPPAGTEQGHGASRHKTGKRGHRERTTKRTISSAELEILDAISTPRVAKEISKKRETLKDRCKRQEETIRALRRENKVMRDTINAAERGGPLDAHHRLGQVLEDTRLLFGIVTKYTVLNARGDDEERKQEIWNEGAVVKRRLVLVSEWDRKKSIAELDEAEKVEQEIVDLISDDEGEVAGAGDEDLPAAEKQGGAEKAKEVIVIDD